MTDCGCENNNSGSITVQDLTDEIKEKLQEIATLSDGLVNIKEITSIAFIQNNKVFVLQSNDQQPINLLLSQNLITNTTYEVKRDPNTGKCCAYEVTHSNKKPSSWKLICCEPEGRQLGDNYYSVNHRATDNKCCIYVQDIIPPVGGNGDPTLSKKREWKCE